MAAGMQRATCTYLNTFYLVLTVGVSMLLSGTLPLPAPCSFEHDQEQLEVTCVLFARDDKRGSDSVYAAGWNQKVGVAGALGAGWRCWCLRTSGGYSGSARQVQAGEEELLCASVLGLLLVLIRALAVAGS
jgi:hypothetical protein